MKKVALVSIFLCPFGRLHAADKCFSVTVIESGNCPTGTKEIGTIEDNCTSGAKEWGTISEYTTYNNTGTKGTYNCSI
jgi:hypothetical protein